MRTLRFHNWWNAKIPPLLSYGYAIYLLQFAAQDGLEVLFQLALLLVWMIGAAAFGHYINDVFDLQDDLTAGKPNKTRFHSTTQKVGIALGLALLALAPWPFLVGFELTLPVILVLAHLLIFLLYSAPPVRLKESGLFGVLSDSVYAHVIPGLVVASTVWLGNVEAAVAVLFLAWQFFMGCRNILNHHIDDYVSDVRSDTTTSATIFGVAPIKRVVKLVFIPLELIAFIVLLTTLNLQWGIVAFAAYAIYTFNREVTFLRGKIEKEVITEGRYDYLSGILLNEWYEKWIPVILLVAISLINPWGWFVLVIHLALFAKLTLTFAKDLSYFKYLVREIVRLIYFGVEKYVKHFFVSILPNLGNIIFWRTKITLQRTYWALVVFKRRTYWAWVRLYRDHVVRIAWIFIKLYYRIEYKLWKTFYKPLKDRFNNGA